MRKLRIWIKALWEATAREFVALCFILVVFPTLTWLIGRGSDWEFTATVIGLVGAMTSIIGFILKYNPAIKKLVIASTESMKEIKELREFAEESDKRITGSLGNLEKMLHAQEERELKRIATIKETQKKTDFKKVEESVVEFFENTQKLAEFIIQLSKMSKPEAAKLFEEWSLQEILNFSSFLFHSNQLRVAELCFRIVLDIDSNNVEALNDLGAVLLLLEQYEEALILFEKALDLLPDSSVILSNIGRAYQGQDLLREAEVFYRKSIAVDEKYYGAFTNLCGLLRKTERNTEALTIAKEGMKSFPEDSDIRTEVGRALHILGRNEKAIIELKEAIKLDPNNDYAHYILGLVYGDINRLIEARDEFKIACTFSPTTISYWISYSLACLELDLIDDAIEALLISEEIEPDNPIILFFIGLLYFKNHMPNEALPYLEKSHNIESEDEPELKKQIYAICFAYLNRIEELNTLLNLKTGDVPEDAAILEAAFIGILTDGTSSTDQDFHNIPDNLKKWNRAYIYAEKIVEIRPEHKPVRILLFAYYFQKGNYEKSLTYIEDGLLLEPMDKDLRINKTAVLIQLKRYEEAYEDLTSLIEEFPEDPAVLDNYNIVLATRGESDKPQIEIRDDSEER